MKAKVNNPVEKYRCFNTGALLDNIKRPTSYHSQCRAENAEWAQPAFILDQGDKRNRFK